MIIMKFTEKEILIDYSLLSLLESKSNEEGSESFIIADNRNEYKESIFQYTFSEDLLIEDKLIELSCLISNDYNLSEDKLIKLIKFDKDNNDNNVIIIDN